jgi:hypothetical protein
MYLQERRVHKEHRFFVASLQGEGLPNETSSIGGQARHCDTHVLINLEDLLLIGSQLIWRSLQSGQYYVSFAPQTQACCSL